MTKSNIEWTEQTLNPLAGCTIVSSGCTHCYAMKMAHRLEAMGQAKYRGTTKVVNGNVVWTGQINLDEKALVSPLKRKKPTMYFVNSMSDLFHENVPVEFVMRVFEVMRKTPWHTYQILTKRPQRMAAFMQDYYAGTTQTIPNVWLGVSVENQATANERIPPLLRTPAAVRFISAEPLLEPIDLMNINGALNSWSDPDRTPVNVWEGKLHQVIVGGESGPDCRPMNIDWARNLCKQCRESGVPFFMKQLGGFPDKQSDTVYLPFELRVREYPLASNMTYRWG